MKSYILSMENKQRHLQHSVTLKKKRSRYRHVSSTNVPVIPHNDINKKTEDTLATMKRCFKNYFENFSKMSSF